MRRLKKFFFIVLFGYTLLFTMFYFLQEKLIFLPTKLPADYVYEFSSPFEEVFLNAADGAVLNAIHFKQPNPKGAILYFHGNAGDLSRWGDITSFFVQKQYDIIVMDYRGYGKSTGKLSEEALFSDAQLFYEYAKQHYKEDELIVYGRSLGTGIASKTASLNNPSKLILETPYYSLIEVGQARFPFLPVKWFLRYKMKSYQYLKDIGCPIVIFHGTEDSVVPYDSGWKLFESIPSKNKKFYTINGGEHNNLVEYPVYQNGIDEVLSSDQSNRSDDK